MTQVRIDTDGLASAYQLTQVTAGGTPVLETGGGLLIGVIILPHKEPLLFTSGSPELSPSQLEEKRESVYNRLAREMTENRLFRTLVERGTLELEQGQCRKLR